MRNKKIWGNSFSLLKQTFKQFSSDRVVKLSAALSYYTVFSLPALMLVIISMTGLFFGQDAVEGVVFNKLNDLVGNKAALQIQETIKNISLSGKSGIASVVGIITLVLSASGIFGEIQDSINMIWGLKAKPKKGFIQIILNRLLSFSLVLSLGFILLVSLVINGVVTFLSQKLQFLFGDFNVYLFTVIDYIIQLFVVTLLFAVIFKILPDAKIKWKDVFIGALVTGLLFLIGEYLMGWYIARNSSIEAYGAAGSVLLLLLWVYYSSAILYFGAEFTQVYAMKYGSHIKPNKYAVWIDTHVTESDSEKKISKQTLKAADKKPF